MNSKAWDIAKLRKALETYSRPGMVEIYYGKKKRTEPELAKLAARIRTAARALGLHYELNREKAALYQEGRRIDDVLAKEHPHIWAKRVFDQAVHEAHNREFSCPSIC